MMEIKEILHESPSKDGLGVQFIAS